MLYFNCDYTEGAHPAILEKLAETNLEQTVGYGEDEYCERARALIRKECQREDADVQFLVGGTQANFTVIRAALRPHQGVIAPATGHINGHETGAVEATGKRRPLYPLRAGGAPPGLPEARPVPVFGRRPAGLWPDSPGR